MKNLFNNILVLTILVITSIFSYSCIPGISKLNQITATDVTCTVNEDKASTYYTKYGNSNITSSEELKQQAFQKLSNMPQEYLDYVFVERNIPISLSQQSGNNIISITNILLPSLEPTSMTVRHLGSFPHEFGHASLGYVFKKHGQQMYNDLETVSKLVVTTYSSIAQSYLTRQTDILSGNGRNQGQQSRETFAELFDTWYCSKAARNNIKKHMSKVYDFAKKYLLPPNDASDDDTSEDSNNESKKQNDNSSKSNSDNEQEDKNLYEDSDYSSYYPYYGY